MIKRVYKVLRNFPWLPLVCLGVAWLLTRTEALRDIEWRSLDWRTQFRAHFQGPPDPRIAIILYSDDTDSNLVAWPPDRAYHGTLSELLSLAGPKVVTWDVILDASREGDGDNAMGRGVTAAFANGTAVITGSVTNSEPVDLVGSKNSPTRPLPQVDGDIKEIFGDKYAIVPFPQLRAAGLYGFVDAPHGVDGIVRQIPLVVRIGRQIFPSLSLQTVMAYYHIAPKDVRVVPGDGIYLPTPDGVTRIPINRQGMYLINYRYDQDRRFQAEADQEAGANPGQAPSAKTGHSDFRLDYPTDEYGGVLLKLNAHFVEQKPSVTPPDYRGKIVLIGQYVTGKADGGPTSLSSYSPLVLVHANVVNNILDRDFVRPVPVWIVWTALFALGYLGAYTARRASLTIMCTYGLLVAVAYTNLVFWGWIEWSLHFPFVAPMIGFVVLEVIAIGRRVWQEQKAKQAIKGMFGSYVSPAVVDRLVKADEPPQLGGIETEITAYFSDIQSFSSFSEKMTPKRLVELMNEYLTACTDIVQEEGGTLDKYIGDAVVAMFGAPIAQPDHALHASVAALRVQAHLGELRTKWRAEGGKWPDVVGRMQSRIGLNTGACIVGNMGSRTRFNYTMMGDDVNLAARMESGAKSWGAYTMCTGATRAACEQHGGDRIVYRPLGKIVVKGRAQATSIHEVVGLKENVGDRTHECLGLFAQGLAAYYARDWLAATAHFQRSALLEPNQPAATTGVLTNPSLVYLKMVQHCVEEPPPADWDGVYVMSEK